MYKHISIILLAGAVLVLGGCSSASKQTEAEGGADAGAADSRSGAEMGGGMHGQPNAGNQDLAAKNVIYFEFDSSEIASEDRDVIAAHAQKMVSNAGMSVVLEGHADERGTREYNIALGERRAKTVQQLLQVQGVDSSRIQVISFGEERPAAVGHDEQSMSLNRRVEFLYTGN